ncbi:MAG: gamma-glutamyl-gamma-aminobutyrate hydrolase family protein [Chloroflexi bacterium]|nr:gamma-glutamyl-gamma-aminobutyrate hydrolase family protein [Chloroflexota bacterium]
MGNKIIGVIPLWDEEKKSIWMLPGYLDAIRNTGGIPVILPLTSSPEDAATLLKKCDGLVMTGGQDVDPMLYGQTATERCGAICHERDEMETYFFHEAIRQNIPVLGICRGLQMINVLLGGTLYQDIPTDTGSQIDHQMKAPYDRTCHSVSILPGTALDQLLQVEEMGVNSYHHQGIKDLGEGLDIMAVAEDGIVEAISLPSKKFVWAVQWHPEYDLTNSSNQKIFKAFVNSCD